MDAARAMACLVNSRHRITDSFDRLDRAARCLNDTERRTLHVRRASLDLFRLAARIGVYRLERDARSPPSAVSPCCFRSEALTSSHGAHDVG